MSSQIYELFGYPLADVSNEATAARKKCLCPFMGQTCDGGGNRYQSFPVLNEKTEADLLEFFNGKRDAVPVGICSLKTANETWIVCPRRLFSLGRPNEKEGHEKFCADVLLRHFDLRPPYRLGIWTEVKIKFDGLGESQNEDDEAKSFDYTFDYILCPIAPRPITEAAKLLEVSQFKLMDDLPELGFTLASRKGEFYIEDFPVGPPLVIEVMTSSTSGGNKAKGTTIQQAFKRAVRGEGHQAPGINYRQVWARMVSQLIVKSQIGKAWGGKTVWVLQDALANYIARTTDLNLRALVSQALKEVNLLTFRYPDEVPDHGMINLEEKALYAGQIPAITSDTDFNKLLQAAIIPPLPVMQAKLLSKRMRATLSR